jgi:hypothetical protein
LILLAGGSKHRQLQVAQVESSTIYTRQLTSLTIPTTTEPNLIYIW